MAENELDLSHLSDDDESNGKIWNAFEAAASQDRITWLTEDGKRVAAIVPVDVAEAHEAMIADVLRTPVGKPEVRYPDVTVHLSTGVSGNTGAVMAAVARAMRSRGISHGDIAEFRQAVFDCGSYDAVLQLVMTLVNVE
jgi:hypothetical protein